MRKAIGPMLKFFAFVILLLFIAAGLNLKDLFQLYAIPAQLHAVCYVGLSFSGILSFLLLFARGQSVQSLVRLTELEAASLAALRELSALLREPSGQSSFALHYDPLRPSGVASTGGASSENPAGWRRRAVAAAEPRIENPIRPKQPLTPAKSGSETAPLQIACSLCGTVQNAGQRTCRQCGAGFTGEISA